MNYNLELENAMKAIKKANAKSVCIQLPDGLKPKADEIAGFLEKNTKSKITIWLGSCFGACDVPSGLENLKVDLLLQWGHNEFQWKKQVLND
jgi:diphthamide biosynthesis enzyme Dph1/Dph2-like protein